MKIGNLIRIAIFTGLLILLAASCDTDIFKTVLYNANPEYFRFDASDFSAEQLSRSLTVRLTWKNPEQDSFKSVLLLRKTGDFPEGPDDEDATKIYSGTSESVDDTTCIEKSDFPIPVVQPRHGRQWGEEHRELLSLQGHTRKPNTMAPMCMYSAVSASPVL
jgi:hypothetical protein